MKHIALGGMSFCGSTVLSYILGSLPGFCNIGESHWLTDRTKTGERIFCAHCGPTCKVLHEEFRASLLENPSNWYGKIAERLNTEGLVSSDKAPVLLDRLDPQRNYDMIVLYKPPELHSRSYARFMRRNGVEPEIGKYLNQWTNFYGRYLDNFEIVGTKLFVDTEKFYRDPEQGLDRVCDQLNLEVDSDALIYWRKHHHAVGGNFNPYSLLLSDPQKLAIVPLEIHPIEEELLAQITADQPSRAVYEALSRT